MNLNHRIVFALLAGALVFFSFSFAPVASAGYEGCSSICSYRPPNTGCSCSNPYFNITCAYYAQYGCSLQRADQPSDSTEASTQPELACEISAALPVEAPASEPQVTPAGVAGN